MPSLNRARTGERPTSVPCEECAAPVPTKPRGRMPRFCVPCLADRERAAAVVKHEQRRAAERVQRPRNVQPGLAPVDHAGAFRSPEVSEALAVRLVDRRLRIEQATPLIRMALLRPDRATPLLREALGLLDIPR